MRPVHWRSPIELSVSEQVIVKQVHRAKLFIFLREHRHEVFNAAFQEELVGQYQDSRRATSDTSTAGAGDDPASLYGSF